MLRGSVCPRKDLKMNNMAVNKAQKDGNHPKDANCLGHDKDSSGEYG